MATVIRTRVGLVTGTVMLLAVALITGRLMLGHPPVLGSVLLDGLIATYFLVRGTKYVMAWRASPRPPPGS